jgi:hypothetical protein
MLPESLHPMPSADFPHEAWTGTSTEPPIMPVTDGTLNGRDRP